MIETGADFIMKFYEYYLDCWKLKIFDRGHNLHRNVFKWATLLAHNKCRSKCGVTWGVNGWNWLRRLIILVNIIATTMRCACNAT